MLNQCIKSSLEKRAPFTTTTSPKDGSTRKSHPKTRLRSPARSLLPPRAPPSRAASGSGTPDSLAGPPRAPLMRTGTSGTPPPARRSPSQSATPAQSESSSRPPLVASASVPNFHQSESNPGSAPPSRPPTSMGNSGGANTLDDLMAAGGSKKSGTTRKGKKGGARYVNVLEQGG